MEELGDEGVISGSELDDGEDDGTDETTPETLQTDNEGRRSLDVLEEELLNDDLGGLDDLGEDDEADGKNDITGGGVLGITEHAGSGGGSSGGGVIEVDDGGKSDNDETDADGGHGGPLEGVVSLLEEDHGDDSREDDHGTTEHLPDGSREVEETDVHEAGGTEIAEGRSTDVNVLLGDRGCGQAHTSQ